MGFQLPWLQKLLLWLIPEDMTPGVGIGPFKLNNDPFNAEAAIHDEAFALRKSAIAADRKFFSAMMAKVSETAKVSLTQSFLLMLRATLYIAVCRTVGVVLRWRLPPYNS